MFLYRLKSGSYAPISRLRRFSPPNILTNSVGKALKKHGGLDCGTGAGGFKQGNQCAYKGDAAKPESRGEPAGEPSKAPQSGGATTPTPTNYTEKPGFAPEKEFKEVQAQALLKVKNAPVPTAEQVEKARKDAAESKRAGGSNRGGSAGNKRAQFLKLFNEFGGDKRGYVPCINCGRKVHHQGTAQYPKFERDKIFTKHQGGGYQLPNLLPSCRDCNNARSDRPLRPENLG